MKTDFERLLIHEGTYWSIYLHENQCYLGRAYLWAKRDDDVDLMERTPEERDEFFSIGRALKGALRVAFNPDRLNYAALSNTSSHLHVHVIPRYDAPRVFLRQEFVDKNPGKNYAPYDKEFTVDYPTLRGIREILRAAFAREVGR